MSNESFQPISVRPPTNNRIGFKLRCLIDLQLLTIAKFLGNEIKNFPPGVVIDIGAGESPWKNWLPKHCAYHGIDIRYSNEFGMSQRSSEITLYDGDQMPFESNSFNGSLCIEVLEHAENPNLLLSEINRIMIPGSTLLLTVPWSARRHHIPHDYHRFTKERLMVLLKSSGFTDITIKERGNDYCAIANKLIVAFIRNVLQVRPSNFPCKLPIILITLIGSLIMLAVAHASLLSEKQDSEDPLGYACKARKLQTDTPPKADL